MINLSENKDLATQKSVAKRQLLREKEGKYQNQPSPINLGVFIGMLAVEFLAAFACVYEDSQDALKALSSASFPVIITLAASCYQAQTYEISKEKEKLKADYDNYLKTEKVNQENEEV